MCLPALVVCFCLQEGFVLLLFLFLAVYKNLKDKMLIYVHILRCLTHAHLLIYVHEQSLRISCCYYCCLENLEEEEAKKKKTFSTSCRSLKKGNFHFVNTTLTPAPLLSLSLSTLCMALWFLIMCVNLDEGRWKECARDCKWVWVIEN